ncbi:MAG: hypothetical protein IJV39_05420 [Ruminococcus sp.]|nr:hypothetical protein [Ruminococcus sp.]
MKLKKFTAMAMFAVVFGTVMLAGCGNNDNSTTSGSYVDEQAETVTNAEPKGEIVSQPVVDESKFPKNYLDIEDAVYDAISCPKKTDDNGKTIGSDVLVIVSQSGGKVTDELKKKIHDEVISSVNAQVDEVECTEAQFDVSSTDSTMGLLTVTFNYKENGATDIKIYNLPLPRG